MLRVGGDSIGGRPETLVEALPALAEQTVQLLGDHFVAFAAGRLQSLSIENGDHATVIINQPGLLEGARHGSHGGAAHAEHLGQELMRELELVSAHPVVAHQQPATNAFLDGVTTVADDGLRNMVYNF